MKKLSLKEFVTIKNLETDEKTTVDDEGNIESDTLDNDGLRPDGSHDGLGMDGMDGEMLPPLSDTDEMEGDDPYMPKDAELGDEELPLEDEGLEGEDDLLGDEENADGSDPDFQGVIRTVTGACLVYKRKTEDGTYEELWIYNVGKNMRNEVKTRRSILAGTDIPPHDVASEDGSQTVETTTVGNVQYLKITGLPN
jgi:hypothetical protein